MASSAASETQEKQSVRERSPERQLTTTTLGPDESTEKAQGPPNGGLTAWIQVIASFCIFFNTWGIVNMYGVFQTYYEGNFLSDQSSSAISWIGSVQAFCLFFVGTLVGPVYDLGHLRLLLISGTFLSVFGMFMTSLCTKYWQVFLAQAIVVGTGFGCLFLPGCTIVPQYFSTKKAFATGLASLGSSFGGVIYPIAFSRLQPQIGFGWATRVIAFIMFMMSIVPLLAMKKRVGTSQRRSLFDPTALKSIPYVFFGLGTVFGYMGIYVVFFYIQLYAISVVGMAPDLAFYLLAIINAGSSFGRVLPNFLADKVGTLNMQMLFALVSCVLSFVLIAIRSNSGVLAFCALYGFFTGTFVSLPSPTVASLSPNLSILGARMSMALMSAGVGVLIGSPVAGVILQDKGTEHWTSILIWSGVLLAASATCMMVARVARTGFKIQAIA